MGIRLWLIPIYAVSADINMRGQLRQRLQSLLLMMWISGWWANIWSRSQGRIWTIMASWWSGGIRVPIPRLWTCV